jgi:hypothetical protein
MDSVHAVHLMLQLHWHSGSAVGHVTRSCLVPLSADAPPGPAEELSKKISSKPKVSPSSS